MTKYAIEKIYVLDPSLEKQGTLDLGIRIRHFFSTDPDPAQQEFRIRP